MPRAAFVLLVLPDDRVVLQRRTKHAPTGPGLLSLYGGGVNEGEHYLHAIEREIGEETSLDIDKINLRLVDEYDVSRKEVDARQDSYIYLYEADVSHEDFRTHEGLGPEAYTVEEALRRQDLTTTARLAIEIFKGHKDGSK